MKILAQSGIPDTGKKVPEKRNMGVINRKIGKLNISMLGMIPVKNIPIEAKASPPKKARGMHTSARGNPANPRGMSTANIMVTAPTALDAAQMISATIISSG